ncbi:ABC transporter ATP-binding protein [Brachybacterium sp. P6-10-X1]|uniref:energy-coupling factor ABC transporter ATP-binding protein n=1 Tax=Brachybacterium sp. P6-10-X1 TaxID=1903186 RepID=UPI00097180E4|nr:ABC transporter ATP-binding protein [Brachybacterium sp. P6-10-X1]APX34003.1 ABC transporter ATP-binding protein [Brachybacterium sp. P6-10-X1]
MDAVTIENLTYTYPEAPGPALQDIDLTVGAGELVSVVGANGSGKSSLCQAIRGFIPHFFGGEMTGRVEVDGTDIITQEIGDLAGTVGFVFQNPFTQMSGVARTVFGELAFGLENLGIAPAEIHERVERILDDAGLQGLRDRDPMQLSGGQQQRVALASVLVMDQPVLVLDEPTSQLDPATTDSVFELILAARARGRTIVLVEHKMEHVAEHSDRVIVMDGGSIALAGTASEVFSDPRSEALGTRLPESMYLRRALEPSGLRLSPAPLRLEDLLHEVAAGLGVPHPTTAPEVH